MAKSKKRKSKKVLSAKQRAARAKFKKKITEAKRIQKRDGISYQAAVKKAFKK